MSKFCDEVGESDLIKDIYQRRVQKTQSVTSPRPSITIKRLIAICNTPSTENHLSEIYCPITNKWKFFNQYACKRVGSCSLIWGDELFIFGGVHPEIRGRLESVS